MKYIFPQLSNFCSIIFVELEKYFGNIKKNHVVIRLEDTYNNHFYVFLPLRDVIENLEHNRDHM